MAQQCTQDRLLYSGGHGGTLYDVLNSKTKRACSQTQSLLSLCTCVFSNGALHLWFDYWVLILASLYTNLSMKHFREHEEVISKQIIKLNDEQRQKLAPISKVLDFAEWARWAYSTFVDPFSRLLIKIVPLIDNPIGMENINQLFARWVLIDTMTLFTFSHSIGFIDAECDLDGIIAALHRMAIMTGLIAALP